jgi:hypothetical protein
MKTSLGIWALGRWSPASCRRLPARARRRDDREKVRRAVEGLGDLIDDYEFHYPQELNATTSTRSARRSTARHLLRRDRPAPRPALRQGRPLSPDDAVRARRCGARVEAATSPASSARTDHLARDRGLQLPVPDAVRGVVGAASSTASARSPRALREHGVKLFLEHKNSEPAMKILMRNIGMTLHVIHKLRARGDRQRPGQHGLAAPDHERREPRRVRGAARRRGAARPPARELRLGHVRRRQHGRRDGVHGDARARARAAPRELRRERRAARLRPLPVHRGRRSRRCGARCCSGASSTGRGADRRRGAARGAAAQGRRRAYELVYAALGAPDAAATRSSGSTSARPASRRSRSTPTARCSRARGGYPLSTPRPAGPSRTPRTGGARRSGARARARRRRGRRDRLSGRCTGSSRSTRTTGAAAGDPLERPAHGRECAEIEERVGSSG